MLVRAIIDHADKKLQIIEANTGEEALIKIETTSVTIAILDLNMPGMDGLMLATELLQHFPAIRIGLLTANIQDMVRQKAKELGIGFIPKPITEEKILSFIYG
jgi:CheY-like chemotaxis protein